jgi:hypothetical protein
MLGRSSKGVKKLDACACPFPDVIPLEDFSEALSSIPALPLSLAEVWNGLSRLETGPILAFAAETKCTDGVSYKAA